MVGRRTSNTHTFNLPCYLFYHYFFRYLVQSSSQLHFYAESSAAVKQTYTKNFSRIINTCNVRVIQCERFIGNSTCSSDYQHWLKLIRFFLETINRQMIFPREQTVWFFFTLNVIIIIR